MVQPWTTPLSEIAHNHFCVACGTPLDWAARIVDFHPAGWRLDGHHGLQRIAFHCEIYGYDASLVKLGIARP